MSGAKTNSNIGHYYGVLTVRAGLAVMEARGLNVVRDGRHMSQKNSSLSLLSGIVLTILAISGLYQK